MSGYVPGPWTFVILALGAYRLTRLGGWDEFPLAAKVRAWVIGEEWHPVEASIGPLEVKGSAEAPDGTRVITDVELVDVPELPGKQPTALADALRPTYRRPTLAHLVHCPFCLGWWVSLACFVAWLLAGDAALVVLAPFAISGTVGLVAKNLDP